MSVYDPYYGRYGLYRAPSTRSYYSYTPTTPYNFYSTAANPYAYSQYSPYSVYSNVSNGYYSRSMTGGNISQRIYFGYNGKLISSYKIRNYRKAQKHVLDLFPDMLNGVASSRIQFYVTRPGYSSDGQYGGFRAYISKRMWPSEIASLAEHETVGIEVRPSISVTESISSFFNRSPFV